MNHYFKGLMAALTLANAVIFNPIPLSADNNAREVSWDKDGLIISGKRVVPVMGEIHFSRIPADEWEAEIKK